VTDDAKKPLARSPEMHREADAKTSEADRFARQIPEIDWGKPATAQSAA
jgi:hypothetical protein